MKEIENQTENLVNIKLCLSNWMFRFSSHPHFLGTVEWARLFYMSKVN